MEDQAAYGRAKPPPWPSAVCLSSELTVTFNGSGSYDLDGTIVSYEWDFGDGSPTELTASTVHPYVAAGTYLATLTVTDDDGGTDDATVTIVVTSGEPGVVFVRSIDMTVKTSGPLKRAVATVLIKQGDGSACAGATVTGGFSGVVGDSTVAGVTGSDGTVQLTSGKTTGSGTATFTVTNVSADGCTYDPSQNVETSDSIDL